MNGLIFRRSITAIARRFPTKRVADRILPWAVFLAASSSVAAAIWQYSNDLEIERSKATLELHKQFRTTFNKWTENMLMNPNGDFVPFDTVAKGALAIRCKVYSDAVAHGELSVENVQFPDCNNPALTDWVRLDVLGANAGPEIKAKIRDELAVFMQQDFKIDRANFFDLARYLRALVICVDKNNCDSDTAYALMGFEMTGFVNGSCPYAKALGPEAVDELRFLEAYLIQAKQQAETSEGTTKKQKKKSWCEFLRK